METKVKLDIIIPGCQMYSEKECKKNANTTQHVFSVYNKTERKNKQFRYFTRNCIPATQSINISKDSYDYMTSLDSKPIGISLNNWKRMSKIKRLENHLAQTCEALGGLSFTYIIFED